MKSLKSNPIEHKNPSVFSAEILAWLKGEGFEIAHNDSYCDKLSDDSYEANCFYKNCSEDSSWHIGVYIFSYGIGVDIDYDCGGNSSRHLLKFEDSPFEKAYDKMVDLVNSYKN